MKGHVYLIKKNDLYLIGKTNNLQKKMKKISPNKIIATLETDHPLAFEARLLRRYRQARLPDSGYFDFSENQIVDCKKQFSLKGNLPRTLGEEFYIALTASILIFIISLVCLIKLGVIISFALSVALALSSLPMFLLFLLGDFGGYNCSDLNIFSSWLNRLKALSSAILLLFLSYINWILIIRK